MRPTGATYWRLGGLSGWQKRTASADIAVSDAKGLRLLAAPGGPLALNSPDGSLGGLALPRGIALDSSLLLYLLGPNGVWVKRWDLEVRAFVTIPEVGGPGSEPRRFAKAQSIAIARGRLFVADTGNRRVQVFDLRTLVLVDSLTVQGWLPVDLVAHGGGVYILDAAGARVFRQARYGPLTLEFERDDRANQWSRIVADRSGKLYLLNASNPDKPVLEECDPKVPPVTDADAVRDLFDTPAIRQDKQGRFALPAALAPTCGRAVPVAECKPQPKLPHIVRTAAGSWLLYVVRRAERRVDVYTKGGRKRHSWGQGMDWQPADVAAYGGTAFILDEQAQTVYRHQGGGEFLKLLDLGDTSSRHWSQIACDARGTFYLYMPGATSVQVFDCTGSARREVAHAGVAALFEAQRPPEPAPATEQYYDRAGNPVTVDFSEPLGSPLYSTSGQWQSKPLDSKVYRCQWHRIELEFTSFPPGSRISVSTCAHEKPEDVAEPTKARFVDAHTLVAPLDTSVCPPRHSFDFLVQSGMGQYLTLRIALESDGFSTPAVGAAKIHYPRESYLQYLPATYSADDEGRVFLERFLSIFQTEWDGLDQIIDQSERYFDPDAVPEGAFMDALARQWLALPLEGDWDGKQKRHLLSAAPTIYPHRGQPSGLRDFLSVCLANLSGLETSEVRALGFPAILEGFREREYLFAAARDTATLGHAAPLWSASVKRRLQLGVYSTEGEVELVSVGDPEHDVFNQYAHRFRVFIPAAWVRTAAQESMLRRALESEKPAHTQYDLHLVESRFRLGDQSTIGLDTIIGEAPVLRLGCAHCRDGAPSLPPAMRLGYDTVLAGPPQGHGAQLGPGIIAGRDTVLA